MPRTATVRRPAKTKSKTKTRPELFSPEWYAWRAASIAKQDAPHDLNIGEPQGAVGHEYGIRTTTRLIRNYRELHRKLAMDITPQLVIDVLVKAGVKKWVLMGLHGYVGYLADPRSTQDVDVMIAPSERKKAVKAISAAWPTLLVTNCDVVVRFRDPNDLDHHGDPKPTIDLMLPWSKFQQTILKDFVKIDPATKHRIPRLEAALVAKYAAMISTFRNLEKKEQDAVDFRRMVRANIDNIDRKSLRQLADEVWEGGADEVERFLDTAKSNRPFVL